LGFFFDRTRRMFFTPLFIMTRLRSAATAISAVVILLGISGCTTGSSAIGESFRLLRSDDSRVDSAPLRPDIQYLRLTTKGRVVLLALGYVEPGPDGDTEVWYSGTGEVLKIRHGRIVGTTGLATDWRAVRLSDAPQWSEVPAAGRQYRRERDVMPGYRYNMTEAIALRPIQAPDRVALLGVAPKDLRWFEERVVAGPKDALGLPPARFAVSLAGKVETTVYAEQCLAADLCLSWQRWPPGTGSR